jgi:hypothetical protein
VATRSVLRGYLLEESLAWMLRHSGYNLLVSADQDPAELESNGSQLRVRGRGTTHQVDVLGEFAFTPAFSLPVRLFLEAKYYSTPCRLHVVRNAYGVLDDVNQNFIHWPGSSRPRRRYQYCYALFSASGFSAPAQEFALAHQISLVDLAAPSFGWLRRYVSKAADKLASAAAVHAIAKFPVTSLRAHLRARLQSAPVDLIRTPATNAPAFRSASEATLDIFAGLLQQHGENELLLGFPPAPFILPLMVSDKAAFRAFANKHPSHPVLIRYTGAEWVASPALAPDTYRLTFNLPAGIEGWIADREEWERKRVRTVKQQFLPSIVIYYLDTTTVRVCHLQYQPGHLHRR